MFAALNAGHPQRAKPNDAGTQQWRGVQVVEPIAERERKVCTGDDRGCISPIDVVAGKDRGIAEILTSFSAKPARPIGSAQPRDADARPERDVSTRSCSRNHPDNLMARHDRRMARLKLALDDVEIGAANTASSDRDQDLARLQGRGFTLLEDEAIGCNRSRCPQDGYRRCVAHTTAAFRCLGLNRGPELGHITVLRAVRSIIFDVGLWCSRVASRRNDDGITSFITIDPRRRRWLGVLRGCAQRTQGIIVRDGQHEYPYLAGH
jgi:hypothetical protein